MTEQNPFTHILVPTDGSETSINAGRLAIQLAVLHHAQITFVYVVNSNVENKIAGAPSRITDSIDWQPEKKGHRYLDYLSRLARDKNLAADQILLRGVPPIEIARLARTRGVDLIVIGQVGQHGPRHVLMGSVAARVVEHASCPVLVVKNTSARRKMSPYSVI